MLALMVFSTGPALAHFCYNASRSEQGNRGAAASQGWFTIEEILVEEGMCPAGIEHFIDNVEETGFPPDVVIHAKTVLANGRLNADFVKHMDKSTDGKGIDHLIEVDWEAVEALFGESFALCAA